MILVQHLPSAKEHRKLDFVALFQEFTGVFLLNFQVMLVCLGPKPDFLQGTRMLGVLLVCLTQFSLLLVLPLAVIHDAADRRIAGGCHLYKIQPHFACPVQGFPRVHNADLIV